MAVITKDRDNVDVVVVEKDPLSIVGKSIRRVDGLAKALGKAKYVSDLKAEHMLIGKALFSKYPHARVVSIDTSAAESLEGVVLVMTAKDLPGRNGYGILFHDKPVIAADKVNTWVIQLPWLLLLMKE
jgi:nicotinate dehydrogenase large molybdopterin subunit